jgi:hypothetical protein
MLNEEGAMLETTREARQGLLAKDMLRHALPSGDDEAILDRALTALLTDLARKKFGAEERTRSSGKVAPRSGRVGAPGSRHVPAPVKRAVWVRDLGRHNGYEARVYFAREAVGEGPRREGPGSPARDREVVPERVTHHRQSAVTSRDETIERIR